MSGTSLATTALPERFNTARRYGVLLVCEGAPESTRWWSVLRFLVRRFTNRRAYDFLPRWLWHPLVYAVVLPRILREQQKMYRSSWVAFPPRLSGSNSSCEKKGHPACEGSAAVVAMAANLGYLLEEWLAQRLRGRGDVSAQVEVGFYHRSGSVAAALERLRLRGHYGSNTRDSGGALVRVESEALIVLPLYPLHKAEFTGSVWDTVMGSAYFQQHHNIPTVHFLRSYAHHEAFLEAWHRHIRRYIGEHGQPDWLFLVFQGTQRYVAANGDTYRDEYTSTADQLRARLSAPWPNAGGTRLPSPEDTAFFRGGLNESRIKTAFLGQGSEQLKEPRLDRVFLSIIRQLKSISARSSLSATPLTSVTNRGDVDSPFCESSAYAAPRLSRTPLPLDMAPTAFVVCPGEALDDAATVWKLQESLFPVVRRLGWRDVQYIPALNDSADHAEVLAAVVDRYLV